MNELSRRVAAAEVLVTHPQPTFVPDVDNRFLVSPEDFVARIPAWWDVSRVEQELASYNLCLPVAGDGLLNYAIGWNQPVGWRNWVLAMTAVSAAGEIVKSGAQVTKSVAGFEIHKFVVGSRDAFLFPVDYSLRVVPLGRRPKPSEPGSAEPELSESELRILLDLKGLFDPTRKLNPGVFGAF
ncbi:MAG: FAD-binding oxidoreductase [Fimbriimonadaceae bacterium]|nr:FAD-binding oxidoreductase [Fimbriimonadaceae bacterium]